MSDVNIAPDVKPDAPVSEGPQAVADIDKKVAEHFQRGQIHPGSSHYEAPPVKLSDPSEIEALAPGTKFIGSDNKTRVKPYVVRAETADQDLDAVPEGSPFIDPTGTQRQKPTFEPTGVAADTLLGMSVTDKERENSLKKVYPKAQIKHDRDGIYIIDEDGTFRRPGRGWQATAGFGLSSAAPVAGGGIGALGAGVPGAIGGAMLGQTFNDTVLQLSGVYDRSIPEQAGATVLAGASAMTGTGVGRGLAAVVPAAKAGVSKFGQALPSVVGHWLGANVNPENTTMAARLAEKGARPPASGFLAESPKLHHAQDVFDPTFRTQDVIGTANENYYEGETARIRKDLGVKEPGSVTKPTTDINRREAGEIILNKTLTESAEADRELKRALEERKAGIQSGAPDIVAQREAISKAADESDKAARALIDEQLKHIEQDVDSAVKISKADANGGELWATVGAKLRAVRRGIADRASKMYDEADQLAGGHLPNTEGLPELARDFRERLPDNFKSKNPDIVQKLEDWGGKVDEEGKVIKEPIQPTFGQLHNLRSSLRGSADWYTLSSDTKNGIYKFFSNKVDQALHDIKAVPELEDAAKQLDRADAFYKEEMPIFQAQQIKSVMNGLKAGEPADPQMLFNAVVKEGQSDLTARIRDMVGPNLWAGVKAADVQSMLDAARQLDGSIDAKVFAREVKDRFQKGMLQAVHGTDASAKLIDAALAVERLEGRLPIPTQPGDTMTTVIARARQAAEAEKAAGRRDPLTMLDKEVRALDKQINNTTGASAKLRAKDPLKFLYDRSTGAVEAVDAILKSEDLILAAAARFGPESEQFNALRQVWIEKLFRAGVQPSKALEHVSEDVQRIMFPGKTLDQMKLLAKETDLLFGSRRKGGAGASMSAFQKVENPPLGDARGLINKIPVVGKVADVPARAVLTKYYAFLAEKLTSPTFVRWLEKGLTSRDPERVAATREVLRKHLQKGAAMGAGAGEAVEQGSDE